MGVPWWSGGGGALPAVAGFRSCSVNRDPTSSAARPEFGGGKEKGLRFGLIL